VVSNRDNIQSQISSITYPLLYLLPYPSCYLISPQREYSQNPQFHPVVNFFKPQQMAIADSGMAQIFS